MLLFGGARRDEEKSRAKERVISFRNPSHQWDPKNQRPELWSLYNSKVNKGESTRVFPLSNWTEIDIWQYIYQENIPLVPLYFSKIRSVIRRNDMMIMVDDDRLKIRENEFVSWSGKFRPSINNLPIYPRPIQNPVPIWLGVGGTPQSFARAGSMGLPLMIAIIGGNTHRFRPLVDIYRQAGKEAGTPPQKNSL